MKAVRATATVILAVILTLTVAGPASGAPEPGPRPSTASATGPSAGSSTAQQICIGSFNPSPQFSASNRTIHVGGRIDCNFTGNLHFRVNLYTIQGSGERETRVWQDHVDSGWHVGSTLSTSGPTVCVGSASTRWIANMFGDSSIGNLNPYPLWGSVYTFPCGGLPD